jgi:DNA-binding LacI/PurR family transcriptional regulator
MATLQEIAREAGVSIETVSRVINGKLKEKRADSRHRAEQIRAIARRLNYRPNAAARAMVKQETRQIGVFIRNMPEMPTVHLSAYETILGVDSRFSQAGYLSCLVRLSDLPNDASRSRVFGEHALDGVVVVDDLPEQILPLVRQVGKCCVWTDCSVWEPTLCVRRDEKSAGRMVAEEMAKLGYEKVIWVLRYQAAHLMHFSISERQEGVMEAVAEKKMELETLIYRPHDLEMLRQMLRNVAERKAAVVAYDAIVAQEIFYAMASLGKMAGRDYALGSCDSDTRTDVYWPELSRAAFNRYQMGSMAADMMLARLGGEREERASTKVNGNWIAGETARAVPGY